MFNEIGWDVIPFSMRHKNNKPSTWESYFVEEIEFGNEYSLLKKLTFVPKVIYSLEARKNLQKLLSVIKPNVCHAHNIYHHITPSILSLLYQRGIPVFLTLHDLKLACPAYTMLTHDGICERCKNGNLYNVVTHKCIKQSRGLSTIVFAEALLHKLLDSYTKNTMKLISPSKFYIEKFVEWGFNRDKFKYIPNFVQIKTESENYNVGKSFLYFGRLSPEKGLKTLITAASLANVQIWFAGNGAMESELKKYSEELNVEAKYFGHLSGENLYEKISNARCVVLPSEWYENAPLSIMESYILGTPVIGADIGGIPELIKNEETGFIFKSGSSESLAAVMLNVSNMPDSQINDMGHNGRNWMLKEFTAKIYRDRLLSLYSKYGIE